MKKLFLVGALALFSAVNAQQAKFGINGGMLAGFANAKTPLGDMSDSSVGFYAGFFAEFNAGSNLKVQPALNYVNLDDASAFQIPVMVKYYVSPAFNLQVGPQFTFDLEENPMPDYYNTLNFGLALGTAYDFSEKLFAEARYSFQLNNHLKNAPSGTSVRANYLNVGLGYKF